MKLYSSVLKKLLLPVGDFIFGTSFTKELKLVEKALSSDAKEIKRLQKESLEAILIHATTKSQYYNSLGIVRDDDPYEWLKNFPILEKTNIRGNSGSILTKSKGLIKISTSGSSGIQTELFVSKQEISRIRAIQAVWWSWAGYSLGQKTLQTGIGTRRGIMKTLKDIFLRTRYLFAFKLTDENTIDHLKWSARNNVFIGGYASSLNSLADFSNSLGIKVNASSVISWGDKLFDNYRTNIEQSFRCKVYETYGSSEGLMIGCQKDLSYMYIMDPYFIVEILNENLETVKDGELGSIFVTSLIHEVFPLIRYRIGDIGILLPKKDYPKNTDKNLTLLKKVIGRDTDIIHTPNGGILTVHSFTGVLAYFDEIEQFQVSQSHKNSFELSYIPRENFNQTTLDSLRLKLESLAGEPLTIVFKEVNFIKDSPSGKPQLIIRKK